MNTDRRRARELTHELVNLIPAASYGAVDVAVFPPFPYLITVALELQHHGSPIRMGAQDASEHADGAFTGQTSTAMIHDCGASMTLVGHSERRHLLGETDAQINQKVRRAVGHGLDVVLCIGETQEQRDAGRTDEVNERQLRAAFDQVPEEHAARVTIAYEPVWAIGTGRSATPDDAQRAHAHVRALLGQLFGEAFAASARIQYGGSVKPQSAAELISQPDIDGFLVGGASLAPADFAAIIAAAATPR